MNAYRTRKLLRRAETIHLKAEELLSLLTAEYGPESFVADTADSVVHQCEELTDALSKLIRNPELHP